MFLDKKTLPSLTIFYLSPPHAEALAEYPVKIEIIKCAVDKRKPIKLSFFISPISLRRK